LSKNHDIIIALKMAEFNRKNKYSFWHSPLITLFAYSTASSIGIANPIPSILAVDDEVDEDNFILVIPIT
jgi:hypothetical protein